MRNKRSGRRLALLLAACVLSGAQEGCAVGKEAESTPEKETAVVEKEPEELTDAVRLELSDAGVTVDGCAAEERTADATELPAVYLSRDIIYYEDRDTYDSGNAYGEGGAWERHTAAEAAAHTVVNITQPGEYALTGSMSAGQIRVDLGEDASVDPDAVVTLVLDGVELTCGVAPAILFANVYECDNGWSTETAQSTVDTTG